MLIMELRSCMTRYRAPGAPKAQSGKASLDIISSTAALETDTEPRSIGVLPEVSRHLISIYCPTYEPTWLRSQAQVPNYWSSIE